MRTELWCRNKNLNYTGISSRSKDECDRQCKELRSKGYTSYVARWRSDPLSRGGWTGYSVYACKRWRLDTSAADIVRRIESLPARREYAYEQLRKELAEIERVENELNASLAEIRLAQIGA